MKQLKKSQLLKLLKLKLIHHQKHIDLLVKEVLQYISYLMIFLECILSINIHWNPLLLLSIELSILFQINQTPVNNNLLKINKKNKKKVVKNKYRKMEKAVKKKLKMKVIKRKLKMDKKEMMLLQKKKKKKMSNLEKILSLRELQLKELNKLQIQSL